MMPETAPGITTERPMGIETEFGIAHADPAERGDVGASSSIMLSHLVVGAYALLAPEQGPRGHRVRWDYGDESPLRDARGFEIQRAAAHPTQLTDAVRDAHVPSIDLDIPLAAAEVAPEGEDAEILDWALRRSISNAVLTGGARWYVDHAHPEYSSPEVLRAREGVLVDRAGEVVAQRTMEILAAAEGVPDVALYKNNTDGKGASYGTHENFLLDRAVPFDRVVAALVPFLASRAIVVGAGRVGIGTRGQDEGFQISSRADFFEAEVGLETTLNRPIVNTRDEPHADASRFRRLHVIIGDANLLETPTYLKLGMTSLVLAALEREHATGERILPRISLADPVAAVHTISHDLSLTAPLPLTDGGTITALEIQRAVWSAVGSVLDAADAESADVHAQWGELLSLLAQDREAAADRVEWVAKLQLLEGYRARHGLAWGDPRLRMIDLQFADLRPARSLYGKLRAAGRVRTLVTEEEAARAAVEPPASTRAHLRGRLIREHPRHVTSAGWDVITLAGDAGGGLTLRCADPRLGARSWQDAHGIDPAADVDEILAALRELTDTPPPRTGAQHTGGTTP